MVTTEKSNGVMQITNFYEIDNDTAKNINTNYSGALPMVSSRLKACADCKGRTPMCCDKSRGCKVGKGELWYQCLYCNSLEICKNASVGGAEVYFLMDQSGSMSHNDRVQAANAVRSMTQKLQGNGFVYSFVAWGSDAGYVFHKETSLAKMSSALASYENGTTGHGGGTNAAGALSYIKNEVLATKDKAVWILLVTDGGFDNESLAVQERNVLLGNKNVQIMAIGVTGARESTLQKMSTVSSFSRVVGDASALTSTFDQIAEMLKKSGNNF